MTKSKHLAVAALSAGAALGLGLWLIARRAPAESVALDGDGGMRALLESRAEPVAQTLVALDPPGASASAAPPPAPGTAEALRALAGPIPEADAVAIFGSLRMGEVVYDETMYYRRAPDLASTRRFPGHPEGRWTLSTNADGFREDGPLHPAPDRRVLVIGDSHTDGVCANSESFANLLEADLGRRHPGLALEVVNAGVGGYTFQNYALGLERYAHLDVDVYVCAVYGGNDFLEVLAPLCYQEGTRMPLGGRRYSTRVQAFRELVGNRFGRYFAQYAQQQAFLTAVEGAGRRALAGAIALTRAMAERADALGVELVLAYVPPMWDVQLERFAEDPAALRDALALDGRPVGGAERWADPWLEAARALDVPVIDLRDAFLAAQEDLYWHHDHHVNPAAHRVIADALLPVVEPLLDL